MKSLIIRRVSCLGLLIFFLSCGVYAYSLENEKGELLDNQRINPKVEDWISDIKKGDPNVLRMQTVSNFIDMIRSIHQQIPSENRDVIEYLAPELKNKLKLIDAILGGIRNREPKIRLSSILALGHMLRDMKEVPIDELMAASVKKNKQLTPKDQSMLRIDFQERYRQLYIRVIEYVSKPLFRAYHLETVVYQNYEAYDFKGEVVEKIPYREVHDLMFYVIRELTYLKLARNTLTPNDFSSVNPMIFYALVVPVWDEQRYEVPIYEMDVNIDILIASLANLEEGVRFRAAKILLELYFSDISNLDKNKIDKARRKYSFLDKMFQEHLAKESGVVQCFDYDLDEEEQMQYDELILYFSKQDNIIKS